MKNILYILLFISSVGYSQTPITNTNYSPTNDACEQIQSTYIPTKPFNDSILFIKVKNGILNSMNIQNNMDSGMVSVYFAWTWSYYATAAVNGYKITKETKYLELVSNSYKHILSFIDSKKGYKDYYLEKSLPSWGHKRNNQPHWWNEVTMPGRITTPACLFLLELKKDSSLMDLYKEEYDLFLSETEGAINAALNFYDENEGSFYCNNSKKPEALNHSHSLGVSFVLIYQLTGNLKYKIIVKQMLDYFKSNIQLRDGMLTWPYVPSEEKNIKPELARKAAVTLQFPFYANKAELFISDEEMQQFVDVFKFSVYQDCKFQSSTDPNQSISKYKLINADIISFMYLSEFDSSVYPILDNEIAQNTTGLFNKKWFSDRMSILAYSYKGLLEKKSKHE
jgi:hypothetical protein